MKSLRQLKLALCQIRVGTDKEKNLQNAYEYIKLACKFHNPHIVVLPEYFNSPILLDSTPKFAEDEKDSPTLRLLSNLAKSLRINIIGGSIPIKDGERYYNTCYCFDKNGEIKARHRKVHLFDIDIPERITFKESDMLSPGNNFTVFETDLCKVGIGICYDIRFPEYAQILKKNYNVDMLVYPAAFNNVTGPMHWDLLQRARALDNNVFLAMCSPARNEDNSAPFTIYGHSSIVDPYGRMMVQTGTDEAIVASDISLDMIDEISNQIPTWKQKRNDMYEINKKI